ncbi:hypothetical protein [Pseudomonas tolaasii]|uniref:hypothetical protein n=1 Tax=Pseudomonas tolaasii TaxID=29442 RepID=UPI001C5DC5BA|nr:hypothetical protein [Pseudomonas tolaasii]MBW4793241.1 hypothetical protein [Pseudomonas tolaasii]
MTQDFVTQNAKAFSAAPSNAFLQALTLSGKTTDKASGKSVLGTSVWCGVDNRVHWRRKLYAKKTGRALQSHILGERFYSVVPVLYGCYFAKLAVVPVSPGLKALTERHLGFCDNPDRLLEIIRRYFGLQGGVWELQVRLAIRHRARTRLDRFAGGVGQCVEKSGDNLVLIPAQSGTATSKVTSVQQR